MPKVVMLAIGSRGDVQPMAVLAGALAAQGVDARVIALREYQQLIEKLGATAVPIASSIDAALHGAGRGVGRLLVRRPSGQAWLLRRWLAEIADQIATATEANVAAGDTVLTGVLTRDAASALVSVRDARMATVLFSGQLPTTHRDSHFFNQLFAPWPAYNRWGTRLNWQLATALGRPVARTLRVRLGPPQLSVAAATRAADQHPTLIAASPLLVPPAPDWPANTFQTGFLPMPRIPFLPEPDLVDFLGAGRAPIYVGFGSMSGALDEQGLGLLLDAARLARLRLITAALPGRSPGLVDDRVLTVRPTPHGWLLPRMAGVVHHGGAGTSQDALAAGVPSVAVPFGVDQPYHGQRLHALGVGPAPSPIASMNPRRLAELLRELTSGRYDQRAAEVGRLIRAEDGLTKNLDTLRQLGLVETPRPQP